MGKQQDIINCISAIIQNENSLPSAIDTAIYFGQEIMQKYNISLDCFVELIEKAFSLSNRS